MQFNTKAKALHSGACCIYFIDTAGEDGMKVPVQRWGNSLAVRIPRAIALETDLKDGSLVDLKVIDGKVVLAPITTQGYRLQEHAEAGTGGAVGNES